MNIFIRLRRSIAAPAIALLLSANLSNPALSASDYQILTASSAQYLPDHLGALGVNLKEERVGTLNDGTKIATPTILYFTEGGPLYESSLDKGDQIWAINNVMFYSLNDMIKYIGSLKPGSTATIDYFNSRDNYKKYYLNITVGKYVDGKVYKAQPLQAYNSNSSSSKSSQSSGNDDAAKLLLGLGALVIGGVVVCGVMGACGGSSSSGSSTTSSSSDSAEKQLERQRKRQEEIEEARRSAQSESSPDTSVGCAWGDRKYGTCQ